MEERVRQLEEAEEARLAKEIADAEDIADPPGNSSTNADVGGD
jgi:hypothetical protein